MTESAAGTVTPTNAATARITSVGVALPPLALTQAEAETLLVDRYGDKLDRRTLAALRKVFSHPSVKSRRFAVDFAAEPLDEDPDKRADRFTRWAVRLSSEAASKALARAGLEVAAVSAVIVNTCTGYICPGISTYLVESLGLPPATRVYDLVGAGCGGAVPNLQLAGSLAACPGCRAVLSVSCEICSATFQMGDDLGLIISNALFGDGAGAAVVRPAGEGLALVDSESLTVPAFRDDIRYVYQHGQLHNQLSLFLPRVLGAEVPKVVMPLLSRHGLTASDVRHWAIHPGGDKVISAVKDGLGLTEDQLRHTRGVLADYGNISSATVWFEMERILADGCAPGDWLLMLTAGAGLAVHAMLTRACPS